MADIHLEVTPDPEITLRSDAVVFGAARTSPGGDSGGEDDYDGDFATDDELREAFDNL